MYAQIQKLTCTFLNSVANLLFPIQSAKIYKYFLRNIILKRTFSSYRSALQSQPSAALPGAVGNAFPSHASADKAVKGFAQKRLPPSLSDTSE